MLERERAAVPCEANLCELKVTQPRDRRRSQRHSHSELLFTPFPGKGTVLSARPLTGFLNPYGIGGVEVAVVGAGYVMGFLVYALTSVLGILAWLSGQ